MQAAWQRAFVRLCLDAPLRARFAETGRLDELELTTQERATLAAIPPAALERFADSLVAKRCREVSRVLPMTLRVSPSIGQRYWRWLGSAPGLAMDTVLDPGPAEALRALPYLHRALAEDAGEAAYAADLLAFEVLACCSRQDGRPRLLRSRYAVHEIAAALQRGLVPMDPELAPTRFRFERADVRWWSAS